MKEFVSAVEQVETDDAREKRIAEFIADGKTREEAEALADEFIAFKVDGRELHAFRPTPGQLIFMMAALGRGQTKEQRLAATINIMMASLRGDDQDYLESRLLDADPKRRIPMDTLGEIFEYLAGEWFATPTTEQSDSAPSPQSDGAR